MTIESLRRVLIGKYTSQKRRKVKDNEIIVATVRKSVAIQHYLLKRKYFSQLGGLPRKVGYYMARYATGSSRQVKTLLARANLGEKSSIRML